MMTNSKLHRRSMIVAGSILACALTVTLGGCQSAPIPAPHVMAASVSGSEGTDSVAIASGQFLSLKLPANSADGFAWRMTMDAQRNGLVSLADRHTEQDGDMAWDVFTFRTSHTGSASIDFLYNRTTDMEPMPTDKRFTLNIAVTSRTAAMAQAPQAATAEPEQTASADESQANPNE